jgi:hypothetical protein
MATSCFALAHGHRAGDVRLTAEKPFAGVINLRINAWRHALFPRSEVQEFVQA